MGGGGWGMGHLQDSTGGLCCCNGLLACELCGGPRQNYPIQPAVTEDKGTKEASSASRGSASDRAGPAAKAATTVFLNFLF